VLYLCAPADKEDAVRAALDGGVDLLQLRDRTLDDDGIRRVAERWRELAHAAGARFVLNDRPDLAAAAGADGVHVGQEDIAPAEARALLGPGALIGASTHAPEQGARAAADAAVSYLSIGPVWATPTKPGRPAAGLAYVAWATANVDKPWFAIGGIDHTNVHEVVAAGARHIVVVRALLDADDPSARARELKEALPERA
jgi:thiamine-phosphate pyrophosphorylase